MRLIINGSCGCLLFGSMNQKLSHVCTYMIHVTICDSYSDSHTIRGFEDFPLGLARTVQRSLVLLTLCHLNL